MANNLPLVTIAAANYNNERYVIDALNSVREQTYENIELIIVDDGSTDNSPKLISEWLKGYGKPYKYFIHPKNLGICKTCNSLIENAQGKYLSFIATDDLYLPDKISSQVPILENSNSNVAMIYSDTYLMNSDGSKRFGTCMTTLMGCDFINAPSGIVLKDLQERNFIHWLSALVKMEVISSMGGYDENLSFEDFDMSVRIARKYEILFVDEIHTMYRIHSNSFSGRVKNWNEVLIDVYLKHIDLPIFESKVKEIVVNGYLNKNRNMAKIAKLFYEKTGKKMPYYFFIKNNINPTVMKIYRKIFSIKL